MPAMSLQLHTDRLLLRQFRGQDLDAFAAIQANPDAARHIGDGQTNDRDTAWRLIAMFLGHWTLRGHGQYAVEDRETGRFVGRVGLWHPEGWPGLEIGWLIDPRSWGRGYATEAARAVAASAFSDLGRDHVISLIHPANVASIRVATKLGAVRTGAVDLEGKTTDVYTVTADTLVA
jgi:RimJ/RimL family protein N-acetyltransferase